MMIVGERRRRKGWLRIGAFALASIAALGAGVWLLAREGEEQRHLARLRGVSAAPQPAPARDDANGWPDRRPIALVYFAAVEYRTPTNPRGWSPAFHRGLTAADPEYADRFRDRLLKFVDACVARARKFDCQGALIWDVEGQQHDHPVTYIGDPRVLPDEMSTDLVREVSRKFTDAGLKVGGTLRPTVPEQTPDGLRQALRGLPGDVLSEKMAFAGKNFGWTLFYVDSNTVPGRWVGGRPRVLPAEVFRRLAEAFPEALLVPEWAEDSYYGVPRVAPLRMFGARPRSPAAGRGDSFEVVAIGSNIDQLRKDRPEMLQALNGGDVFLVLLDRDTPSHGIIFDILREGRRSAAGTATRPAQ